MAHELYSSRDMAYVGDTPWHGLGIQLNDSTPLDQWRIAANLNWEAEKRQIYYSTQEASQTDRPRNIPTPIKDKFALVRSDTQADLGIVSDRYKIVQPAEVLEFYRDLVADNGFTMETAGQLKGGQRIWALAKMGDNCRIMGQDEVQGYLLLATSYDGTMATIAKFTSVRVVCQNTLSFALRKSADTKSAGSTISIGHNATFDASSVKQQLGIHREAWDQFEADANHLAETKPKSIASVAEFMRTVLGDDACNPQGEELSNTAKKVLDLAANGKGQSYRSAMGTYWGLVNAVTEYYDHHSRGKQDSRLNSAWFGRGDTIKRNAFNTALELANAA